MGCDHPNQWTLQCQCGFRFVMYTLDDVRIDDLIPECLRCGKKTIKALRAEKLCQLPAITIGQVIKDFELPSYEPKPC